MENKGSSAGGVERDRRCDDCKAVGYHVVDNRDGSIHTGRCERGELTYQQLCDERDRAHETLRLLVGRNDYSGCWYVLTSRTALPILRTRHPELFEGDNS